MSRTTTTRASHTARRPQSPPFCEGWIDKYALCRGMFVSKGWHRRYVFLTSEGLGFSHTNPRDKGNYPANRPLKPSHAKSFVPFSRKRHGEVELQPVYVVDDVSAAHHPAVPQRSHNGICSETVSMADNNSASASAKDLTKANSLNCTYYYFGLTFEEHKKRYLLLLRTDSPQEYIKWTTYLPLYVHEGSAMRLVPLGHPLEAGRPQPVDVNHRRLTDRKESTLPSSVTFYFDPDPCTPEEYVKVRRMCLGWDEGQSQRLFVAAIDRVESLCGQSESNATESLAEVQEQSEEEYRRTIGQQFDVLGAAIIGYETQCSPQNNEKSNGLGSAQNGGASPLQSTRVDATDAMADDASGPSRSKPATNTFAPSPFKSKVVAQQQRQAKQKQQQQQQQRHVNPQPQPQPHPHPHPQPQQQPLLNTTYSRGDGYSIASARSCPVAH